MKCKSFKIAKNMFDDWNKILARKFYFATVISVRSTLSSEKGRIWSQFRIRLVITDPGSPKTYGSGSGTLMKTSVFFSFSRIRRAKIYLHCARRIEQAEYWIPQRCHFDGESWLPGVVDTAVLSTTVEITVFSLPYLVHPSYFTFESKAPILWMRCSTVPIVVAAQTISANSIKVLGGTASKRSITQRLCHLT